MKKTIIALGMQLLFASVALASNPYREAAQRFAGSEWRVSPKRGSSTMGNACSSAMRRA